MRDYQIVVTLAAGVLLIGLVIYCKPEDETARYKKLAAEWKNNSEQWEAVSKQWEDIAKGREAEARKRQ